MKKKKLGEILLEAGLITVEQLEAALALQKIARKRIGKILVESGYVNEAQIVETLSRQLLLPLFDCQKNIPSKQGLALVTRDIAEKKLILPLEIRDKILLVAMANPLDWQTMEDLTFKTGLKITVAVSSEKDILNAIEQHYGASEIAWDTL